MISHFFTLVFVVLALVILLVVIVFISFLRIWLKAMMSAVPIPIFRIIGIKLRGNPAHLLVDAHILLAKQNVPASLDETEFTYMENRNRVHSTEDLVRLVKEKKARKN